MGSRDSRREDAHRRHELSVANALIVQLVLVEPALTIDDQRPRVALHRRRIETHTEPDVRGAAQSNRCVRRVERDIELDKGGRRAGDGIARTRAARRRLLGRGLIEVSKASTHGEPCQ